MDEISFIIFCRLYFKFKMDMWCLEHRYLNKLFIFMKFGIIIMILTNRSIGAYAILKKEYVYFVKFARD